MSQKKLFWNTLVLLLIFISAIGVSFLLYQGGENKLNTIKKHDTNNLAQINTDLKEMNNLIVESDKVIKELEKFSDLENIDMPGRSVQNEVYQIDNDNYLKYIHSKKEALECIADKVSNTYDDNRKAEVAKILEYDNSIKSYLENINYKLIELLQRMYSNAHVLNVERNIDLENIDNLPGRFM